MPFERYHTTSVYIFILPGYIFFLRCTSLFCETSAHREWFLTRVVPAAIPFFRPVSFCEPAIGSGVMMLAAASQFPDWAVALNLVVFSGMDTDVTCVRMARTNSMLYGLNGYSLKLAEAVGEATEGRTSPEPPAQVAIPKSPQAALDQAVRIHRRGAPSARKPAPKFEKLVQLSLRLEPDRDETAEESNHDGNL